MLLGILSTQDVAEICKVHITTVINWVKEGILKAYTTPGGHRRIKKEDLMEFMKKYKMPIPEDMTKRTKNVLIVEDDLEALREYSEALSGHGFVVKCASNGFDAGCMIYKDKPDLILLDFKMPGMDGFAVCEMLKSDKKTRDIPIIAVTALTSDEEVARIKNCKVTEYLAKPVDIERLLGLIKKILGIETLEEEKGEGNETQKKSAYN